jgi:hypothetical protein
MTGADYLSHWMLQPRLESEKLLFHFRLHPLSLQTECLKEDLQFVFVYVFFLQGVKSETFSGLEI